MYPKGRLCVKQLGAGLWTERLVWGEGIVRGDGVSRWEGKDLLGRSKVCGKMYQWEIACKQVRVERE